MSIKNIIFDIGNVLLGFDYRSFFQSFGYDEATVERLAKATAQSPDWNEFDRGVLSYEEVLQRFVANDPELEPVIFRTFENLNGILRRYEYAIPWIRELKDKGYKVYYLSNFFRKVEADCAETMDFMPYMDGGILSYREKVTKPEGAIYQLLLSRYGLKAEESVFLDDTEKNIVGARKEGIYGIVFQNKAQACEELRKLGVNA